MYWKKLIYCCTGECNRDHLDASNLGNPILSFQV